MVSSNRRGARYPGSSARSAEEVGKCKFFMAYMHESVHICHLSSRFFRSLSCTKRYPGQIFLGATTIAPVYENVLNLYEGIAPGVKLDEKTDYDGKNFYG